MKRITLFLAIVAILLFVSASLAIQNDPDGFRGLSWGTSFSSVEEEMTYVNDIDLGKALGLGSSFVYQVYNRQNDKMSLGSIDLSDIIHLFYEGYYEGMIAFIENEDDFQSTHIMLSDRFGRHDNYVPLGGAIFRYEWVGNKGVVCLEHDPKGSIIWMISKKMVDTQNQARKKNLEDDF
jgi:hypothetical protein